MRRLGFDGGLGSGRVTTLNACKPRLSIIVLNYNGARWLDRCVDSLRGQTILGRFELLLADNRSTDGSDLQARRLMDDFPGGCFIDNGGNLGFCEGNAIKYLVRWKDKNGLQDLEKAKHFLELLIELETRA